MANNVKNKGFWGVIIAIIGSITALSTKDALPPICIFQVGVCGGKSTDPPPGITTPPKVLPPQSTVADPSTLSNISKESYLKNINAARTNLSARKPDLPLQFPLGTSSPIDTGAASSSRKFEVIGYLDKQSKKVKPITSSELLKFLDSYGVPLYEQVANTAPSNRNTLDTLDLLALDISDKTVKTLDSVDAGSFLRDAINSTLNGKIIECQYGNLDGLQVNN
jgi:hypothetical protein